MSTLISWCLDCGSDAEFDHTPGAAEADYFCLGCGAAVFVAATLDEVRFPHQHAPAEALSA